MFSFHIETPQIITTLLSSPSLWDLTKVATLNGPFMETIHSVVYGVGFPLLVFFIPNSMQIVGFVPYNGVLKFKTNIKTAIYLAILLFISFLTFIGDVSQSVFLYFNF